MTLEQIIKSVTEKFNTMTVNPYGYKSLAQEEETVAGKLTFTISQQRSRSFRSHTDTKITNQFKLNNKIISKKDLLLALGETSVVAENPILKAAFLARAPELAAEYAEYIRRQFARVGTAYTEGIPRYVSHHQPFYRDITCTLRDACKTLEVPGNRILSIKNQYLLVLDESYLQEVATTYGQRIALDWYYKTNDKLGDVQNVNLGEPVNGDMVVTAERDDVRIVLNQQRILKQSPKGLLFHQFPARIYVDKKFTTEAAYKKMFKTEA